MTKSVITIEREFFEEDGITKIKRTVKEDGILICENTIEEREILENINDSKLCIFEKWIYYMTGRMTWEDLHISEEEFAAFQGRKL